MTTAFILVIRDAEYWLIGPFANRADAGEWGTANWDQSVGRDDPRWQTVELSDPPDAPYVWLPQDAIKGGRGP